MFDSLSLSYSFCNLLRFSELIFGLEILQLSRSYELLIFDRGGKTRIIMAVDDDEDDQRR